MSSQQNIKQRHHHVWQKYLKPWTTDGAIWCLQNGRIFPTGTTTVAVERNFYYLHRLTVDDLALLRALVDSGHPLSKRNYIQLLSRFMNEHPTEALEEYHTRIEASFIPNLESALSGDISFYSDDQRCPGFLNFLSTQYMRTKGAKERAIAGCSPDRRAGISRLWNVAVLKLAMDVGASLYSERNSRKLVLIHNRTEVPFITGDQPAINLKGTRPRPPEKLSIYYPISPRLALLLAEVDETPLFADEGLTPAQASFLNMTIFEACYQQVFGKSEESLRSLRLE
jgi:Protein of unknown function (DUF4238)